MVGALLRIGYRLNWPPPADRSRGVGRLPSDGPAASSLLADRSISISMTIASAMGRSDMRPIACEGPSPLLGFGRRVVTYDEGRPKVFRLILGRTRHSPGRPLSFYRGQPFPVLRLGSADAYRQADEPHSDVAAPRAPIDPVEVSHKQIDDPWLTSCTILRLRPIGH
jgi:hypothetical protein